jgi:NADH dehydrogenase
MTDEIVVLGAGYAGTGAVQRLERSLEDPSITWVSDRDYHLVLHEVHRVIRDPAIARHVKLPVEDLSGPATTFVEDTVTGLDTDDRLVQLEDADPLEYDYCLVALGSETAFFGIPGLAEHANTLKSLDDALAIHEAIVEAANDASRDDPAQIVVGGAGLSGIQSAGEIAKLRDRHGIPIDVHLVEGLDSVFPPGEPPVQQRLHELLVEHDVRIHTGSFIGEVDAETVYVGETENGYETNLDYDVLLWAGGVRGPQAVAESGLDAHERNGRVPTGADFRTNDERVFAVGDTALVGGADDPAPPTAQAAWDAAKVAGENVARAAAGKPLREWTYEDKGTLVSVGDEAVAHGIDGLPIGTFGGMPAETLKKAVAARWIASISTVGRAARAWRYM